VHDPKSKFCRTAVAIAKAWGAVPYHSFCRKLLAKQLEPVRAAMARSDFPKKVKQGFPHDQIFQFGKRFVEVSNRGRDITVRTEARPETNGHGDFQLSDPKEKKRIRIEALTRAFFFRQGRKLDPQELEELREAGIITRENSLADGQYPKSVKGQPQIASLINHKFKITCHRAIVQRWRKQAPIPFPPPDDRGEYNVSDCFSWVEKVVIRKNTATGDAGDLFAQASEWEARGKIAKEKHEEWVRQKERGGWVKIEELDSAMAGCATEYWQRTVQCIERELIAGLEAQLKGMPDDSTLGKVRQQIIADARARHLAAVDSMQREFAGQETKK
jgi:hypothetical protein